MAVGQNFTSNFNQIELQIFYRIILCDITFFKTLKFWKDKGDLQNVALFFCRKFVFVIH